MGRRAKKAPVVTKKRPKLAKCFKCPFCANEDVVECKMDFKKGVGSLACRLCGAAYSMPIHSLHEPVDVFSEWLDDCEAAAHPQQPHQHDDDDDVDDGARGGGRYDDDEEDDDDDDIPESSGLRRKNPGGDTGRGATPAAGASAPARESYTDLGLEDSDDDDDDDE